MALLISNAILHTLGSKEEYNLFSDVELEVDSETCYEFVGRHVRRLLRNPAAKEAVFTAGSPVYGMVKSFQQGEIRFKELSRLLCSRLSQTIGGNEDIPPSDILVVFFDQGKKSYLALIKLNYGECFLCKSTSGEDGTAEHQIVKNTSVLPLNAAKVEEACLIPYDPMVLRILEKPHFVGGELTNYFSQLFLECETQISKKETAEVIQEIADEVNAKHFSGSPEMSASIKTALIQEAEFIEQDDGLILDHVAERAFQGHQEAKQEFLNLAKEYKLPHQIMLDKPFVQRSFKMQQFKSENGVEIKFPAELCKDPDQFLLVTNPDGSVTITLKNLYPKA